MFKVLSVQVISYISNKRVNKTVLTHNVVVPSCGRMRRGCCWMVMGEPGAEPDPELPDDMLGGWTSDR